MIGSKGFGKTAAASILAFLISQVPAAAQQRPQPVMPRDQWIVDWGDQRCTLMRRSGGDAAVTLGIKINPGLDTAEVFLADSAWERGERLPRNLDIVFRPSGERIATPATRGRVPLTGKPGLTMWNVDARFYALFASSERIDFEASGTPLTGLAMRGAAAALLALRRCNDDLLAGWGIDPVLMASLRSRPEPLAPWSQWVLNSDYPLQALRLEQAGTVVFRFLVGIDGRASDCRILSSSGHESLDRRSCEVWIERSRYRAAIGGDGTPVAVPLVMTIRYQIL